MTSMGCHGRCSDSGSRCTSLVTSPRQSSCLKRRWRDFVTAQNPIGMTYASSNLGLARHALGDKRQAASLYRESLVLHRDVADGWEAAALLMQVAALAADVGYAEQAACLFGASATLYQSTGTMPQPYEVAMGDRAESATRAQLGPERYQAAWAAGRGFRSRKLSRQLW